CTSSIDGLKKRVRKVPVSNSTTNDHSAISPSRKDQWSGNTLLSRGRMPATCSRSSSARPVAAGNARRSRFRFGALIRCPVKDMSRYLPFPERRPHRDLVVGGRHEVALVVQRQREH